MADLLLWVVYVCWGEVRMGKKWTLNSRLLVFSLILLPINQQTAVPGGTVTHMLWEDRAEPGARR